MRTLAAILQVTGKPKYRPGHRHCSMAVLSNTNNDLLNCFPWHIKIYKKMIAIDQLSPKFSLWKSKTNLC